MERIKINLPEKFSFSTSIAVRITDVNYGGHVGNDAFLSIIHEARIQFLQHFGYSEMSVEGVGLIMADVAIEYKKELSYGDIILIEIVADGFDKLGFDIFYKLEINVDGKKVLVGKAKTGMMCFNYAQKKRVTIPEEAITKLTA
jgi:acyl-CoA thioester hydrolase